MRFFCFLVLSFWLTVSPSFADVENQIDSEELLNVLREISETAEQFARISELGEVFFSVTSEPSPT